MQDGSGRLGTELGDFNLDGLVNTTDLTILATYYGTGPGDPDVVPEPATLSLLALGGLAVLRRRK